MTKLRRPQLDFDPNGTFDIGTSATDILNLGNAGATVGITGTTVNLTGTLMFNGVEYVPTTSTYTFNNGLLLTGSNATINLSDTAVFSGTGAASRVPILNAASRLVSAGVDRAGTLTLGTISATSITLGHDSIPIELTGAVTINGVALVAYTDEEAQDAVGSIFTPTSTISLSYDDTNISASVIDDSITNAKLANVATSTFKGRATSGTGDPEDLTLSQARTLLYYWDEGLIETDGYVSIDLADTNIFTTDGTAFRVPILGVNNELIASGVDGYYDMEFGTVEATSIIIGHDSISIDLIGTVTVNGSPIGVGGGFSNPYNSTNQVWTDDGYWSLETATNLDLIAADDLTFTANYIHLVGGLGSIEIETTESIYMSATNDIILSPTGTLSLSPGGILTMGSNRVRNCADPAAAQDAVTLAYLQAHTQNAFVRNGTHDLETAAASWTDIGAVIPIAASTTTYIELSIQIANPAYETGGIEWVDG